MNTAITTDNRCLECGEYPIVVNGRCQFCHDEFKRKQFNGPSEAMGFGPVLEGKDVH